MVKALARFLAHRTGSIALVTALAAPALIGCLGIAADYLVLLQSRTKLQSAADAAALASVQELDIAGTTTAQIGSIAKAYVERATRETVTADQKGASQLQSGMISIAVQVDRKSSSVSVELSEPWSPVVLGFLSPAATPIMVRAKAHSIGKRLACVVGLAPLAPPGVQLWADARLEAVGCDVYSNTALPTGLVLNDNATLKANLICVAGGYVAIAPGAVSPKPVTDCPPFEDPLAKRSPPPASGCDYLAKIILNKTVSLDPGVYCGGLTILGNSHVTLNPGVYVIRDGLLKIGDTASMVGENVGFYLTGTLTLMAIDNGTTIDLTAPKDGPLAGILFFEDRDALPLRIHHIGSNNAHRLIGTIYLPAGILLVDANAPVADNSAYTAIISRSLQLRQGPDLVLHGDYTLTDVPVPDGLIVGRAVLTE